MSDPIGYVQAGGVGILSLARPEKLNAMDHAMGDMLQDLVVKLNADPTLRCVLVCGEGRAFSAGGDLGFLERNLERDAAGNTAEMLAFYTKYLSLRELAVPSIALLHGRATGAGLCLALGCDIRLAAEDALLSLNFVKLGLTPGMAGTWSLPRLVGPAMAAELLYTGRTLTGAEAARIGLVNQAVPAAELMDRGELLASEIAANGPAAVRATKVLLREAMTLTLADGLDAEARAQAVCFAGQELREGIAAVREKRKPAFGS